MTIGKLEWYLLYHSVFWRFFSRLLRSTLWQDLFCFDITQVDEFSFEFQNWQLFQFPSLFWHKLFWREKWVTETETLDFASQFQTDKERLRVNLDIDFEKQVKTKPWNFKKKIITSGAARIFFNSRKFPKKVTLAKYRSIFFVFFSSKSDSRNIWNLLVNPW